MHILTTNDYRRVLRLAAWLVLLLAGCGGGGGGSQPSPYAGSYTGTWTSTTGDVGTVTLAVAQSGALTGALDDTTAKSNATITGSMAASGTISGLVTISNKSFYRLAGTFAENVQSQLTGILTGAVNGTQVADSFTLTRN